MTEIPASDRPAEIASLEELSDRESLRERDGIASLRDTEGESGDEEEVDDTYELDERAARELGIALDDTGDEPKLS